ncbi:hypothetical protein APSETT445_004283 [Aspergillus pseudonomiae]
MRGCLTCRQRHLKCDKTGAVCLRCQRSGRQCIPAPSKPEEVTFRHGQNPSLRPKGPPRYGESDLAFPDDQIWVNTPPEVAFEDETDPCALSQDLQRHLLAGSVYIGSHVDCAFSGGLAEASFWAFVMQDVQFALATRSPLRLTIGPFEERLRLAWEYRSAKTDRDWAHRALWLLAQTINYCYEPSSPAHLSSVLWDVLKKKICDWEMRRPDSFRPLHFSPATTSLGRPFPVVWFTSASHGMFSVYHRLYTVTLTANAQAATAAQQICMAKALMHEYELRTHQFAASPNQGRKLIENAIVRNLNIVLGIALSADDDPPVRIMACHALSACRYSTLQGSYAV